MDRRHFIKRCGTAAAASIIASPLARAQGRVSAAISVDPAPRFEVSPRLYMQFMEPLGVTDGSVEASWNYLEDDWRADLIDAVQDLAPDVIRWGGNFIRHYKWREAVGPVETRRRMFNYYWGGTETNRVGTHEFADFCRRVDAEPLMCVNFLSDGHERFAHTERGEYRVGDAREAADWVSYANDPDNAERRAHGVEEPYGIKLWQVGNETSYTDRGFDLDSAVRHTKDFAAKMRARDPSIELIGWGDDQRHNGEFWAPTMLERAGDRLNMIAMHMMGMRPIRENTVLGGFEYQKDPAQAWHELLELAAAAETRLKAFLETITSYEHGVAVTEGHLSIDPHNSNPILQEWLSAAYHAATMNMYLRNGHRVKICTGADFCGTRWTVNAVRIPVPRGRSFLLPVASIMRLFNRHKGTHGVTAEASSSYLDVAATRDENAVYLHVLNTSFDRPVEAAFAVGGQARPEGRVLAIAPEEPRAYVDRNHPDRFTPAEHTFQEKWRFPARSVSVVILPLES